MRVARVERSAVAALLLISAAQLTFALKKGVAVSRVVRRRINDKSARFGTPGPPPPPPVDVEKMETRCSEWQKSKVYSKGQFNNSYSFILRLREFAPAARGCQKAKSCNLYII